MTRAEVERLNFAADKRAGLPMGTMNAITAQETGWKQEYLDNPFKAHYKVGPNGEKPASTAYGLYGVTNRTAAKPGFGMAPLRKGASEAEVRDFASTYLAARIKSAGSFAVGVGGYGDGTGYAKNIEDRLAGRPVLKNAPSTVAMGKRPPVLGMSDKQVAAMPVPRSAIAAQLVRAAAAAMPEAPSVPVPVPMPVPIPQVAVMQTPPIPGTAGKSPWSGLGALMPEGDPQYQAMKQDQVAMANEVAQGSDIDKAAARQAILQKFGLGQYGQELQRYQANLPEFTRPA